MFTLLSPTIWRILAVALVLAALTAAVWGFYRHAYQKGVAETTAVYEAALAKQKTEAAQLLSEATGKVLVYERKLAAERAAQEAKDAKNKTTVTKLAAELAAAGRLRDPGATGCRESGSSPSGPTPSSPADRPADRTEGAGLLSQGLTDLLLAQAAEADAVNLAYIACRADAYSLRQ